MNHLKSSLNQGRDNIQVFLENELERLKLRLRIDDDLRVSWTPDSSQHLDGEVKRGIIFVYNEDPDKAAQTLRHEVLDFLISRLVGSQQEITNKLILLLNERAYKEKEALVEKLVQLLE